MARVSVLVFAIVLSGCFQASKEAAEPPPSPSNVDSAGLCAQLMPSAIGASARRQVSVGTASCRGLAFDGQGDALQVVHGIDPYGDTTYLLVDADGGEHPNDRRPDDVTVAEQLEGFLVLEALHYTSAPVRVEASGPAVLDAPPHGLAMAARDPRGGMAVWFAQGWGNPSAWVGLSSYDSEGGQRWFVPTDPDVHAMAVDSTGATLLISWAGPTSNPRFTGVWVDSHGDAGQPFGIDPGLEPPDGGFFMDVTLAPAPGSGFFIKASVVGPPGSNTESHAWTRRISSLSTRLEQAPSWLGDLGNARLAPIRAGAGYLVMSSASGNGACAPPPEVFTADGHRCGALALPSVLACPSAFDVSPDGTLQEWVETSSPQGSSTCTWAYWRALLR